MFEYQHTSQRALVRPSRALGQMHRGCEIACGGFLAVVRRAFSTKAEQVFATTGRKQPLRNPVAVKSALGALHGGAGRQTASVKRLLWWSSQVTETNDEQGWMSKCLLRGMFTESSRKFQQEAMELPAASHSVVMVTSGSVTAVFRQKICADSIARELAALSGSALAESSSDQMTNIKR